MNRWVGEPPVQCQLCNKKLSDTFVDGKVSNSAWAIMCPTCHKNKGCGLGLGKGQKYHLKNGIWEEIK